MRRPPAELREALVVDSILPLPFSLLRAEEEFRLPDADLVWAGQHPHRHFSLALFVEFEPKLVHERVAPHIRQLLAHLRAESGFVLHGGFLQPTYQLHFHFALQVVELEPRLSRGQVASNLHQLLARSRTGVEFGLGDKSDLVSPARIHRSHVALHLELGTRLDVRQIGRTSRLVLLSSCS